MHYSYPHAWQVRESIGAHVAEAHGGAVEWGHLKADVKQYGGQGRQYEILGDESPPAGRAPGRGRALGPPVVPGAAGARPRAPPPQNLPPG